MCGICGELRFDGSEVSLTSLQAMTRAMDRRGPDSSGVVTYGSVGFGHRRLSIIDLSARGSQPMVDAKLGLSIAFNGCIYNYADLRAELATLGYEFFSNSDTETILKAYHAWGAAAVERFNGMFAFAIHERDTGRVVLARDRLGIKPLYISEDSTGKMLRFASSLPAVLKAGDVDTSIDPVALNFYMSFHAVVPPPHTILRGVRKLPPATVRTYEADGKSSEWTYWTPRFERTSAELELSAGDWKARVHEALRKAVARRMIADVPVGVLLSGGVDSSLIVGLLAEAGQSDLKTFSIGFEAVHGEQGDEFQYSDLIAKHFGTDHHKLMIDSKRMLATLPNAIAAMSEPMVSHDNVGFYLLSEAVSQHVKVVQSGQGADEVFGGYHWYPPLANSNDPVSDYKRAFFDRDLADYRELIADDYIPEAGKAADHALSFVEKHFARPGADTAVDRALRLDTTVMLVDDPVKRVDNMTMAWGLEGRVPFLDHELVELAGTIPPEEKLKDGGKGILKDVARDVIPAEVIDRPKGYFPVPALKYIEGTTLDLVRDALNSQAARERGLYNRAYIDRLLDDPKAHITPLRGSKLWQVSLLEMWLQSNSL